MNNKFWLGLCLGGLSALSGFAAQALECTASPDCAALGYKQTTCATKGIKCPFDKTKMFCISAGASTTPFKFANVINQFDIVYSDGSTKATYDPNKTPIGIVAYVHENGKGNHGLVMSLRQPLPQKRDEAIKQCKAFVTKGTQVGDWHVPDMAELMAMSMGDRRGYNSEIITYNNQLKIIPGTDAMGYSYARDYFDKFGAYNVDYLAGSYLQGAPAQTYYWFNSFHFWSVSDSLTTAYQYVNNINNPDSPSKANYLNFRGHFRCVAAY